MAPAEFHRYIDARGDSIIYKFDPDIARAPDPRWPNDSPISVFHHYTVNKQVTVNYHSNLLPLEVAMERWRNDKQSMQPLIGTVMYNEKDPSYMGAGAQTSTQYVWKGWSHGEGYRRGWAKLSVSGPPVTDLSVKLPLMWRA